MYWCLSPFLAAFICFIFISSSSGMNDDEGNMMNAMNYLTKFGYMTGASSNLSQLTTLETLYSNAIMEFQSFAQIEVTGILDNETYSLMQLPRCGVKDKVGFGAKARRRKRYALQGSKWRTKVLLYDIVRYPDPTHELENSEVDSVIQKAFNIWSEHTDLTFTRKRNERVHIEILFGSGEHGDGDPFDGRGGTLAHAYFPIYGGDAHFDDQEKWTIKSRSGTDLLQVAAHEFGHSLGLSHSDVRSSLMAPFYRGYDPSFTLHQDDIRGIQKLYGKKPVVSEKPKTTTKRPVTVTTTKPPENKDETLCSSNNKIDAIVTVDDQDTYVFKGSQTWKLTDNGVAAGYPKPISSVWKGVPSNIDAVFQYTNGKTFFFKGDSYYRVQNKKVDEGYPKKISSGFGGIPNNVDAAFVWSGNGKIYFFKGGEYYKFEPKSRNPVAPTYPRPVSYWEGLPNNIDAALQYSNGYTYFFKGDKYYRFNDNSFRVDRANPPFPRSAGEWWFGCKGSFRSHVNGQELFNSIDTNKNNIDTGSGCDGVNYILNLPSKGNSCRLLPSSAVMVLLVFLIVKRYIE